jgi:hypothetical protein
MKTCPVRRRYARHYSESLQKGKVAAAIWLLLLVAL